MTNRGSHGGFYSSQFCMHEQVRPHVSFLESPKHVWGHCTGSFPWPRAIDCLVHWSSPVNKLVFSQQYGPVRRSSPVRKLVATEGKPLPISRHFALFV